MKITVVRKVFSMQFCFIRCRRQHLPAVEYRRYSRSTFVENTKSNLPKVTRATFLGSNGLFCFISICKFGSFQNPIAMITSLSELYFRSRRFILLKQMKKMISRNYVSSTSSWKPWKWVRLHLLFSMRDIYNNSHLNPLTEFTCSSWSTKLKDILPWNICQMITETIPISTRIVKLYGEMGHPILNLMGSQWKLREQHDQNFPMEWKPL